MDSLVSTWYSSLKAAVATLQWAKCSEARPQTNRSGRHEAAVLEAFVDYLPLPCTILRPSSRPTTGKKKQAAYDAEPFSKVLKQLAFPAQVTNPEEHYKAQVVIGSDTGLDEGQIYAVDQPFGSQKFPDLLLFYVINGTAYLYYVEAKQSKGSEDNTKYTYNEHAPVRSNRCAYVVSRTLVAGTALMTTTDVLYEQRCRQILREATAAMVKLHSDMLDAGEGVSMPARRGRNAPATECTTKRLTTPANVRTNDQELQNGLAQWLRALYTARSLIRGAALPCSRATTPAKRRCIRSSIDMGMAPMHPPLKPTLSMRFQRLLRRLHCWRI